MDVKTEAVLLTVQGDRASGSDGSECTGNVQVPGRRGLSGGGNGSLKV